MEFKVIVSLVVIALTLFGYVPYIVDIFKGKTKPHLFSWLSGSIAASLAFGLQVEGGAGVGSWPMLMVALSCFTIFILSFKYGTKDIVRADIIFLALSLFALFIWVGLEQSVLSIVIISASQILAFVPTVRKSWKAPYTETLFYYEISSLRHVLAIVALERINLLTALYPSVWVAANIIMTLILISRRRVVTEKP